MEPKRLSLLTEKGGWESELRKAKGQLYYLQSLEKVTTACVGSSVVVHSSHSNCTFQHGLTPKWLICVQHGVAAMSILSASTYVVLLSTLKMSHEYSVCVCL